ncbi:hypothetical protein GGR57DRAFT_502945 [Xylariaceae sp. FL1272]|nr:hypothetical protein GGR57DRAFT_502945 [Xylariaceae sp. FL1272]
MADTPDKDDLRAAIQALYEANNRLVTHLSVMTSPQVSGQASSGAPQSAPIWSQVPPTGAHNPPPPPSTLSILPGRSQPLAGASGGEVSAADDVPSLNVDKVTAYQRQLARIEAAINDRTVKLGRTHRRDIQTINSLRQRIDDLNLTKQDLELRIIAASADARVNNPISPPLSQPTQVAQGPYAPKAPHAPQAPQCPCAPKAPHAPQAPQAPCAPQAPQGPQHQQGPHAPQAPYAPQAPQHQQGPHAPQGPQHQHGQSIPVAQAAHTPQGPQPQNVSQAPQHYSSSSPRGSPASAWPSTPGFLVLAWSSIPRSSSSLSSPGSSSPPSSSSPQDPQHQHVHQAPQAQQGNPSKPRPQPPTSLIPQGRNQPLAGASGGEMSVAGGASGSDQNERPLTRLGSPLPSEPVPKRLRHLAPAQSSR